MKHKAKVLYVVLSYGRKSPDVQTGLVVAAKGGAPIIHKKAMRVAVATSSQNRKKRPFKKLAEKRAKMSTPVATITGDKKERLLAKLADICITYYLFTTKNDVQHFAYMTYLAKNDSVQKACGVLLLLFLNEQLKIFFVF